MVPELTQGTISDDLYDLIRKLTSANPNDRPNYETVMNKLGIAASKVTRRNEIIEEQKEIYVRFTDLKEMEKRSAQVSSTNNSANSNSTNNQNANNSVTLKSIDDPDSQNTYLRKVDGIEMSNLTKSQAQQQQQEQDPSHKYAKTSDVRPKQEVDYGLSPIEKD